MTYWRFLAYNVIGGVLWGAVCLFAGFFFGNLPFVKQNFSLVILAIVFVSILPAVVEYLRHRSQAKRTAAAWKATGASSSDPGKRKAHGGWQGRTITARTG